MKLERVANEIFQILRSYNYEVALYNEDGAQVYEPEEARRFFDKKKNLQVALIDDGDDSKIKLYFRKDIPVETIEGLIQTLRTTATKFNIIFSCKEQDGEISPKDFATKVSVAEARRDMNITEGMYGTSRSSYLRLENARMIIRHSAKVNEEIMGARGRNINTIHVENGLGERFLFPTTQLAPARALVHHVSNGGSWGDEGGQNICNLAKDYANMCALSRHIHNNANHLPDEAKEIRLTIREAARGMRKKFESICRRTRYEDVMQSLKKPLVECDLSEKVAHLKSCCAKEGCELDESIFESCARCLKEYEDRVEQDRNVSIAGVLVDKDVWAAFKRGDLDLSAEPSKPEGAEGYRAFVSAALRSIGEVCADPDMAEVLRTLSDDFGGKTELTRAMKAFAAKALEIVHWEVPKMVAPTDAVKEFVEWCSDHTAEKACEPEDEIDEHCGLCADEVVAEEGPAGDDLEIDIDLGDGDDLSMADIIIPTDQGDTLASEVSPATVDDPETGEEELPSTEYIERLRALSGVGHNLNHTVY